MGAKCFKDSTVRGTGGDEVIDNMIRKIRLEKIHILRKKIADKTPLTDADLELISVELKKSELIDLILFYNKGGK
jgi:hypothetical protein